MKTLGLILVAVIACLPLFAAPGGQPAPLAKPDAIDLSGIYHATGKLAKGVIDEKGELADRKYHNVVLLKQHKGIYAINWIDGGRGVGFLEGDSLIVSFQQASGGLGAARYRVEVGKDGKPKLLGKWVSNPGNGEQHSEDLLFMRHLEE